MTEQEQNKQALDDTFDEKKENYESTVNDYDPEDEEEIENDAWIKEHILDKM